MPTDLNTPGAVAHLVDAFYDGIEADPWLGRFFEDVDMKAHRPRLVAFWNAVVFQSGTYRGQPIAVHARLDGLTPYHFARWLDRFRATVDARFRGPHAERAKARAEQIAGVMQVKLGVAA